jgi:hypothetical protein
MKNNRLLDMLALTSLLGCAEGVMPDNPAVTRVDTCESVDECVGKRDYFVSLVGNDIIEFPLNGKTSYLSVYQFDEEANNLIVSFTKGGSTYNEAVRPGAILGIGTNVATIYLGQVDWVNSNAILYVTDGSIKTETIRLSVNVEKDGDPEEPKKVILGCGDEERTYLVKLFGGDEKMPNAKYGPGLSFSVDGSKALVDSSFPEFMGGVGYVNHASGSDSYVIREGNSGEITARVHLDIHANVECK